MNKYNQPIVFNYHINNKGELTTIVKTNEQHNVVDNKVILSEIPDKNIGVYIDGMTEVNNMFDLNEKTFYVDYQNGIIYFKDFKQANITISKYGGRGVTYYPASRVYLKTDDMGKVISTLDDIEETLTEIKHYETSLELLGEKSKENIHNINVSIKNIEDIFLELNKPIYDDRIKELDNLNKVNKNNITELEKLKKEHEDLIENSDSKSISSKIILENLQKQEESSNNVYYKIKNIFDEIDKNYNRYDEFNKMLQNLSDTNVKSNQLMSVLEKQNSLSPELIETLSKINSNSENYKNTLININNKSSEIFLELKEVLAKIENGQKDRQECVALLEELKNKKEKLDDFKEKADSLLVDLKETINKADLEKYITKENLQQEVDNNIILTYSPLVDILAELKKINID